MRVYAVKPTPISRTRARSSLIVLSIEFDALDLATGFVGSRPEPSCQLRVVGHLQFVACSRLSNHRTCGRGVVPLSLEGNTNCPWRGPSHRWFERSILGGLLVNMGLCAGPERLGYWHTTLQPGLVFPVVCTEIEISRPDRPDRPDRPGTAGCRCHTFCSPVSR